MALDESITLEQGQDLQRQRELESARLAESQQRQAAAYQERLQRRQQITRAAQGQAQVAGLESEAEAAASTAATKAYRSLWDRGQDILEQVSLAFMGIVSVLTGPFVFILSIIRLDFIRKQFGTYRFRDISVDRVPGYDIVGGVKHGVMDAFITCMSILIWTVILIVAFVVTNPAAAQRIGMCNIGNVIASWFNMSPVCAA